MSGSDHQLVICNAPDMGTATAIAKSLVNNKLCACVNILPQVQSIYIWENKLEETEEITLLIKTTKTNYSRLEKYIKELHPYQLPEIIAIDITNGLPAYLEWITANTGT